MAREREREGRASRLHELKAARGKAVSSPSVPLSVLSLAHIPLQGCLYFLLPSLSLFTALDKTVGLRTGLKMKRETSLLPTTCHTRRRKTEPSP